VIHEHEDLLLASAGMDFGLTPEESDRLDRAIRDCPICAERATAYRRQVRLLTALPVIEPSDALRRKVQAAALSGGRTSTASRSPLMLLAATVAIGSLLAVGAVVGGAFREKRVAEFPPNETPSGPTASDAAIPSALPSPDASGLPTSGPGGPPVIAVDSVGEVRTDNLRLRSQPRIATDSIKFEPLLDVGDRFLVLGEPVTASNHDWYHVAVWRPSDPEASWPIGWIATADVNGTPWIGTAAVTCPAAPTVDVLAAMTPYEALACYRDQTLSVRALVIGADASDPCPADALTPCLGGPAWLAGEDGRVASVDASGLADTGGPPSLPVARNPDGPVSAGDLPAFRMVQLEGHFDDPAADSCRLVGAPTSVSTRTNTDAVLRCRTRFVVSAATPEPAFLTRRASAATVTDGLRVRSIPLVDDTSERYEPLLAKGTRLFVTDGPVLGSGYVWYRVVVPGITRAGGEPMIGWVAVAGKDGELWAQDVALGCPAADQPIALADIARLGGGAIPDGGLSCYGDAALTTSASVQISCAGTEPSSTDAVAWLAAPARMTARLSDADAAIDVRVHPELAGRTPCDRAPGERWTVTGHFDDVDSESCATTAPNEAAGELAIYRCRTIFVVTDLAPAPAGT
jgi:hypothetical protein